MLGTYMVIIIISLNILICDTQTDGQTVIATYRYVVADKNIQNWKMLWCDFHFKFLWNFDMNTNDKMLKKL